MEKLEWTGERLTTELEGFHGVIEHLHRYALAQKLAKNKIVLDIASGEGYGSNLLSQKATFVYGVDVDENSILHSRKKYGKTKNLEFIKGSTDLIPLPNDSVDLVVSFETIEHHDKHQLMMDEINRVLKKDGILIISSPERSIYKQRDPDNPFHIKELLLSEFKNLLESNFSQTFIFNQRFVIGSLVHLIDENSVSKFNLFDGDYLEISNNLRDNNEFYNKPYFNLAICSNNAIDHLNEVGFSLFNGVNVLDKEIEIYKNKYNKVLNSKTYRLANIILKIVNKVRRIWKK